MHLLAKPSLPSWSLPLILPLLYTKLFESMATCAIFLVSITPGR